MRAVILFALGIFVGVGSTYAYMSQKDLPAIKISSEVFPQVVYGKENAPLTIQEFSSLGCGACAYVKNQVWPKLKEEYIDQGRVKWIMRSYPLSMPDLQAAMLAHCHTNPAALFKRFFETQEKWLLSKDPSKELKAIAEKAGMDNAAIEKCLENETFINQIIASRIDASEKYVREGTPTFVIGRTVIPGAMPLKGFHALIEQAEKHYQKHGDVEDFLFKHQEYDIQDLKSFKPLEKNIETPAEKEQNKDGNLESTSSKEGA